MSKQNIKLVYFLWWSYSKVLYDFVATGHPFRAPIWRQSPDRSDGYWVPSDSDRSWDLPCLQHLLCHCNRTLAKEHMRRDADCQHAFPGTGVAFADWSPAQRSAHNYQFGIIQLSNTTLSLQIKSSFLVVFMLQRFGEEIRKICILTTVCLTFGCSGQFVTFHGKNQ